MQTDIDGSVDAIVSLITFSNVVEVIMWDLGQGNFGGSGNKTDTIATYTYISNCYERVLSWIIIWLMGGGGG